jgi:cytidylate kinase
VILLVDGRSGSGKTEFATSLAAQTGAQLVRLDALYPGWGGLERGSLAVATLLTEGRWQRWDWVASATAEWHSVDLTTNLIVEGCGAISPANLALADASVWIELDAATRKERALARDGDAYAPHWEEWASQEALHIAREHPALLADEIIDGTDVSPAVARWRVVLDPARVEP